MTPRSYRSHISEPTKIALRAMLEAGALIREMTQALHIGAPTVCRYRKLWGFPPVSRAESSQRAARTRMAATERQRPARERRAFRDARQDRHADAVARKDRLAQHPHVLLCRAERARAQPRLEADRAARLAHVASVIARIEAAEAVELRPGRPKLRPMHVGARDPLELVRHR